MPKAETTKLERLRGLAASLRAQIEYATRLVQSERQLELVQAALDVLAAAGDPAARPVLLGRYAELAQEGTRRDPGCYLRAAIMRALRYLARRDDGAVLERAVTTYEFMPPGPIEVAAGLRSAALVTLNEVDETLAAYHSVRLLTDRHTSQMSGEPAVTAAQVLAAQGHELPLYAYVLREGPGLSEVIGECLRCLTPIPASLLAPLVERYIESQDEIVLLGLFDLLLAHEAQASYDAMVLEFLHGTRLYNIYRYLVSMIVASRRDDRIAALTALAAEEKDHLKAEILREALALR